MKLDDGDANAGGCGRDDGSKCAVMVLRMLLSVAVMVMKVILVVVVTRC